MSSKKDQAQQQWRRINPMLVLPVLLVVLVASTIFFGYKYFTNKTIAISENKTLSSEEQKQVLDSVAQIYDLPDRDHVTVVSIGDTGQLKGAPELSAAQKGDFYIRFNFNNHSLLYRPNDHKIVKIINTGAIVALYLRGDVSDEYARKLGERLQKASPLLDIQTFRANDISSKDTVVVVNNPSFSDSAQSLAKQLGGNIGDLPQGETYNNAASIQIYLGTEAAYE